MSGFIVSTAAVFLTAWIVYAATRRAAWLDGYQWRDKELKLAARGVPAGTRPECIVPKGAEKTAHYRLAECKCDKHRPSVTPPPWLCKRCGADGDDCQVYGCNG